MIETDEDRISGTLDGLSLPNDFEDGATIRAPFGSRPPPHLPLLSLATKHDANAAEADLLIISHLGTGGMGVVRVAEQRSLSRQVAVKTLKSQKDTESAEALLHEGMLTGRLEHPNIVPVHQAGWTENDGPVIVMKRIEGVDWKAIMHQPENPAWVGIAGDPLERNLRILMDVCRAVEYAHSRGVVHLDIKPANVMVGQYGEVYLLDWGVAGELVDLAAPASISGTPGFLAPEQVPGFGAISVRTDVYLLGAVLHTLLTNASRNQGSTGLKRLESALRGREHEYDESVPSRLGSLANRACSRDPGARPADAAAFRAEVEEFLQRRGAEYTARRASERLEQLHSLCRQSDDPDPGGLDPDHVLRVHRQFSACKFGFEQSLQEWPEGEVARDGLEAAIETMFDHELAAGRPGACELLLADLPRPRPDLQKRLDAALDVGRAADEELAEIRRQQRFHGNDWGRSIFISVNGLAVLLFMFGLGWFARSRNFEVTAVENFVFLLLVLGAQGVAIFTFRKQIFETEVFGRMAMLIGTSGVIMLMSRLAALIRPIAFLDVLLSDYLVMLVTISIGAFVVSPLLWFTAIVAGIGMIVGVTHMEYMIELMGILYMVHSLWLGWNIRPQDTDQP